MCDAVTKAEERGGAERLSEEIMGEKFPNLINTINSHTHIKQNKEM